MTICTDNIAFGSLAQGAAPNVQYMTSYNNRDALKDYFAGLARDWEWSDWQTKEFIAQGDRVVVLGELHLAFKKTGKVVSTPKADVWRMKTARRWSSSNTTTPRKSHAAVA